MERWSRVRDTSGSIEGFIDDLLTNDDTCKSVFDTCNRKKMKTTFNR